VLRHADPDECRKRQAVALREFQVGGVKDFKGKPLGEAQRRRPGVAIGVGIDGDRQQGGVSIWRIDALARIADWNALATSSFQSAGTTAPALATRSSSSSVTGVLSSSKYHAMVSDASITRFKAGPR
jgi:hypothetical protein